MHVLTLDGLVIVLSLLNFIMLKQQLQQKLQQKLSPQQIQLIRLLELPAIELEERIKHELEDNPALEEGKEIADDFDRTDEGGEELAANEMEGESETDTDLSLGDYMSEDDIPDYKLRELNERAEKKEDVPFSVSESLNEYLLQQLGLRDLPEKQVKITGTDSCRIKVLYDCKNCLYFFFRHILSCLEHQVIGYGGQVTA